MAINSSILGSATSRLWSSPVSGVAASFGLGAGLFAGVSTFASTDGSTGDKADAGLGSAIGYGVGGAGLVMAGAYASAFRSGYDKYAGSIDQSIAYGAARNIKSVGSYAGSRFTSHFADIGNEFRSPGGWKTALARPTIAGGLGALIGGYVGRKVSDDSNAGTAAGAALGGGAGVAIGRVVRGSSIWSKWGGATRAGSIVAASVALGGALGLMSDPDYETTDVAESDNPTPVRSGIKDRMGRMGANGDLVFGLHRSR